MVSTLMFVVPQVAGLDASFKLRFWKSPLQLAGEASSGTVKVKPLLVKVLTQRRSDSLPTYDLAVGPAEGAKLYISSWKSLMPFALESTKVSSEESLGVPLSLT